MLEDSSMLKSVSSKGTKEVATDGTITLSCVASVANSQDSSSVNGAHLMALRRVLSALTWWRCEQRYQRTFPIIYDGIIQ